MADDAEAVMDQITETLDQVKHGSPVDKLESDKALFAKVTGEEFGTPTPKAEKDPEPVDEPEEVEAEEEEKPADPRVVAARKGLAQAGYPATSVEGASDEEALGWWNRHTEQDFDRATAKEQALDLQRRLDTIEKERQTPEEPPKPLLTPEPMIMAFKEQFGDEAGEALSAVVQAYVQQGVDTLNQRVGGLETTWSQAEDRNTKAMTAANRSRLQDQVPQLENDMAWKAVEDAAGTLIQSGKTFLTADQLFDEAVKSLYGDNAFETKEDETTKKKKKIRSATPTTESRRRAPETLTADQKQHASDWDRFMKTEQKRKAGEYR